MSETVYQKGTLYPIAGTSEKVAEKISKELGATELKDYYDNWVEHLTDMYNEEYFYDDKKDQLYKIEDFKEIDPNEAILANKNQDGSISFDLIYYNGGVGMQECLQEALDKI